MYKEGKVYIPKDDILRAGIIRLYYDIPVGGHGGQWSWLLKTSGSQE